MRISLVASVLALAVIAGNHAPRAGGAHHPRALVLPTGRRPEPILWDPVSHHVYVGNESRGTVSVVDERTNRVVARVSTGRELEDMALDAPAHRLYTASRVGGTVSAIDTHTLQTIATADVGKGPSGVALDPVLHRLYVTDGAHGLVKVLDAGHLTVSRVLRVGGDPQGIGVDTGLHRFYVGRFTSGDVLAFDAVTFHRLGGVRVGAKPVHPIRVDSRVHLVYVVSEGASTLTVIDGTTVRFARTIATGSYPEGLDIAPNGRWAYIANEGDPGTDRNSGHSVSIVDLRRAKVIDTRQTLQGPDGVAYDGRGGQLYVCDENSGKVSILQLSAHER
ncbi:MAG: hypothetical protein NVS4B2_05640 [Chloroflexota bacterium]